jgi:ketosteroid isomerase-like protein
LLLAGCGEAPAPEAAITPAPIVAAERAFAAEGFETGVKASFMKHAAPDAIMFAPGPVNVQEFFAAQPDAPQDASRPHLVWWPVWAGIAKSGDLGFTTGPYGLDDTRVGYYFTVWKKQPDGSWKWVIDAGVDADPAGAAPQGSDAAYLPTAERGAESAFDAVAEVERIEVTMPMAALTDHLAPEARVHTEGVPPGTGPDSWAAALAVRPVGMTLAPQGARASGAGDLVWTWGEARCGAASSFCGYIVRVWQKQGRDWRIVFDEFVPRPPPEPAGEGG